MDFGNAALLIAAVYGITELVKALLPDDWSENPRVKAVTAVGVAFAATFLVAATTWANEQVIGTVPLDQMSVADKVLVSIFAAGAAALTQRVVKAVSNVGVPMPSAKQQAGLDAGADRLAMAQAANAGGSHDDAIADTSVTPPT